MFYYNITKTLYVDILYVIEYYYFVDNPKVEEFLNKEDMIKRLKELKEKTLTIKASYKKTWININDHIS